MAADKTLLVRAGLVAGTLVLGGIAYFVGTNIAQDRSGVNPSPAPTVSASANAAVSEDFVEFEDETGGIKFSYPKSWKKLEDNSKVPLSAEANDPVNRRIVLGPSGSKPLMFARVIPLPAEIVIPENITTEDLGVIQGQLDKLIVGPDVRVAEKKPTNHKGKLAWRYLYDFKQGETGREGAHVHYFIFDGAKINVLVFEALPASTLEELAPVFDKILSTFESETRIMPRPGISLPPLPSPSS